MTEFPRVPLSQVLTQDTNYITELEPRSYLKLSVRLYGRGVTLDAPANGSTVKMARHQLAKSGQVILSEIWAKKGAIGIVPPKGQGALVTSHFFLFDIDKSQLSPRFLYWLLDANYFADALSAQAHGTTGYAAIRPKQFLALEIPLPSITEQQRIVARVDALARRVEEARGLRRAAVGEAEILARSELSRLFDFDFPGELPKGWKWLPFEALLKDNREGMTTGPFGSSLHKSDIQSDGVPILGIPNIQPNRFVPSFSDYISFEKAEELSRYQLEGGDIVVARSGTVGRSCVVPCGINPPAIMSSNLIRLRINTDVFLPELLSSLLNGSRLIESHKEKECRGSTRNFFTQKILFKFQVPVPPLAYQRRIVAYLDGLQVKVDELRRLQAETQKELDALMPSILAKAFAGEL